jgi:hypothetical protein
MLTKRYLVSTKHLDDILKKVVDGVAPPKFNIEHLKSIGFAGSNDRAVVPMLKDLGYLAADGTPQKRYHDYRDRSRSTQVMAEALREAYEDVFHIREVPTPADRPAIEGLFKSKHNSSDKVAQLQAMTFFALLKNADLKGHKKAPPKSDTAEEQPPGSGSEKGEKGGAGEERVLASLTTELHYTIQVHLPATKDIEVFNAIFRSLRDNLLS